MEKKIFNKGDAIVRQGEMGNSFFRIEKGSAEVTIKTENGEEKKLSGLSAGQFFGEMAVVEAYPRSATVTAAEDGTEVTEIGAKDLNDYFTKEPDKILELFRHISDRLRALTDDYQEASATLKELEEAGAEKSEGLLSRIGKALSGLFGDNKKAPQLSAEAEEILRGADFTKGYSGETVRYNAGTLVFREGEPGPCMYAIHWGKVGIYAGYGTDRQTLLTELLPGAFFGEMGMIEKEPRSATAVVLENDTTLEVITPDGLEELFTKNPAKVDMILQGLSYRLRKLTIEYTGVCDRIREKQSA